MIERRQALFAWIVSEGGLTVSPLARIPAPIDRPDQVDSFTDEQVNDGVLREARSSRRRKPAPTVQPGGSLEERTEMMECLTQIEEKYENLKKARASERRSLLSPVSQNGGSLRHGKEQATFSDALAAGRTLLWGARNNPMSCSEAETCLIPRALWRQMQQALAYAV